MYPYTALIYRITDALDLHISCVVSGTILGYKICNCSGRRVFYSIATGRTTEIAEVSRRQPLDVWKTGPEVLTNGKLRRENADAESGIDSRLH